MIQIKNRHLRFCVILLITSLLFNAASAQIPSDNLDTFLINKMKERRIPGMQIAIVRQGKIILSKSYGIANAEDSVSVTPGTVFPIHSITKAFTGIAAMQLVEDGKLDLDAPVSRYLDSLPDTWRGITIRQLMTHMSGIPDIIDKAARMIDGDDSIAWAKVMASPILFAPGEKFKYTMTNYILIGKVIDKLTGRPFTSFIKERQFDAVGMPNTGFSDSRDVIPHLSESYWYMRNIHNKRVRTNMLQIYFRDWPPIIRAAAGINTTAEELAKWSIAVQKEKLVSRKSLQTLWTPGTLNDGSHQSFSTIVNGYGLGWPVTIRSEHPAYGPTGGGCTALFIYPGDDLTIVVLTNLTFSDPESFIDEIAGYYIPEMHAYNGFGFGPGIRKLNTALRKRGFESALESVNEIKKNDTSFHLPENDVNGWGYALSGHNEIKNAMAIFKLNTSLYPKSGNAFDSYGEVLLKNGNRQEAIKMYQRSVELNPANQNGKNVLAQLLKE